MSHRAARLAAALGALLVVATGCSSEKEPAKAEVSLPSDTSSAAPAPRKVSAAPSPRTAAVPTSVPVGRGEVAPTDPVWAQDSELHVASAVIDVSPLHVDSFVVVRGGVFLVDDGELWFTDLTEARDTGLSGVSRLSTTRDDSALRVELRAGSPPSMAVAFSAADGAATPVTAAVPATVTDRLGRPVQVILRPDRSDLTPATPQAPRPARRGPGHYGLLGGDGEPLVAFEARSHQAVNLAHVLGTGFELVRWTSGTTFYGLALEKGKPLATIGCDLEAGSCTTYGRVQAGRSLVFESGT